MILWIIIPYLVDVAFSINAQNIGSYSLRASSKEQALRFDSIANICMSNSDYTHAAIYKEAFCQYWLEHYTWQTKVFATQLNNLAYIKEKAGLIQEAIDVETRVLKLRRVLLKNTDKDFLATLHNLSYYHRRAKQWNSALELLDEQISILDSCQRFPSTIKPRILRANLKLQASRYGEAIHDIQFLLNDANLKWLTSSQKSEAEYILCRSLLESGQADRAYAIAIRQFDTAIKLRQEEKASSYLCLVIPCIQKYGALGSTDSVTSRFISTFNRPVAQSVSLLNYLAEERFNNESYREALSVWEQARKLCIDIGVTKELIYSTIVNNLANCYIELKDYEKGLDRANEALDTLRTYGDSISPTYINTLHLLSMIYMLEGDGLQSAHYLERELNSIHNHLENNISGFTEKERFPLLERYVDIRDLAIYATLECNAKELAATLYNVCLNYKNAIYQSEEALRKGIELNLLSTDFINIRDQLGDRDLAVEFVTTTQDDTYVACILRKNWAFPKIVFLGEISLLSEMVKEPNILYTSPELTSVIWRYILEDGEVMPGDNIFFSPDGIINNLAIEYLPYEDGLISEHFNIYRLSSTSNICHVNRDRASVSQGFEVFSPFHDNGEANSNQNARNPELSYGGFCEVEDIYTIAKENNLPFAFSDNWDDISGGSSVLHIATHGYSIPTPDGLSIAEKYDWGMQHTGIFATNNKADEEPFVERITCRDLRNLNLENCEVLSLASCLSNGGTYTFDGIIGLQRGAMMTGASSIITSLWNVNDATSQLFFKSFYQELANGSSIRQAMLSSVILLKETTDNPYYWAPFILIHK